MKTRNVNLTEGSPLKQIIRFSVPLLFGGLLQQLYGIVDMAIVGHYCGLGAFSAVGATGPILFFYIGALMGFTGGAGVVTAQKFGAGDEKAVRKSIATSFIVAACFVAVFAGVALPLVGPMLKAMQFPAEIFADAKTYLLCIFGGSIATALYNTVFSQSRAIGDSLTPLVWLCVSTVLNIAFNVLFVAVFKWGVFGVGIATVLVSLISSTGCLLSVRRKYPVMQLRRDDWKIDPAILRAQLRTGVPMSLQFLLTAAGIIVRQAATNTLGADAVGSYAMGEKIESFMTLPIFTLGLAMATYAAQNLGAGKINRLRSGIRSCMRILAAYSLVACAAAVCLYAPITRIFIKDPSAQVLRGVFQYLALTTPFYIALSGILVYRNALQGMDFQTIPFIGGIIELVSRGAFAFPMLYAFGYAGVVSTNVLAWVTTAIFDYAFYRHICRNKLADKAEQQVVRRET